jgi:hypothetical protein
VPVVAQFGSTIHKKRVTIKLAGKIVRRDLPCTKANLNTDHTDLQIQNGPIELF